MSGYPFSNWTKMLTRAIEFQYYFSSIVQKYLISWLTFNAKEKNTRYRLNVRSSLVSLFNSSRSPVISSSEKKINRNWAKSSIFLVRPFKIQNYHFFKNEYLGNHNENTRSQVFLREHEIMRFFQVVEIKKFLNSLNDFMNFFHFREKKSGNIISMI